MVQVAAEDTYADYVICRGFDPRILKFIDYEEGNSDKPGISVAKPFGKRSASTYEIAEVHPAFLPTQGNSGFDDFRQVIYTPPSPTAVEWRVGQNPGVVTGGLEGGQPENLTEEIGILYDHNGKVVNWMLIDSSGAKNGSIEYTIDSVTTAGSSSPYNGLKVATVTIELITCGRGVEIGDSVEVVDHSGCIFNEDNADLVDRYGWADWKVSADLSTGASPGDLAPCHWSATGLCCPEEAADPANQLTTVTSNYTLVVNDPGVLVDAKSGAVTITLPTALSARDQEFLVKKIDTSANAVTIDGSGSEEVDESLTRILSSQYDSVTVYSDGTEWWIK